MAEEGADKAKIENEIKTMPNYFSGLRYDRTFYNGGGDEERSHPSASRGFVLRGGKTGWNKENGHVIEYSLKLDSNPEFTSSIIVSYARAAYRMNAEGAERYARPYLILHRDTLLRRARWNLEEKYL